MPRRQHPETCRDRQRRTSLEPTADALLDELAEISGIRFSYTDGLGTLRSVDPEIRREFFERMGLCVSSEQEIRRAIEGIRERVWLAGITAVRVMSAEEADAPWSIYLPEGFAARPYGLKWILHQEDGQTRTREIGLETVRIREKALVDGQRLGRMELPPPPLPPPGYHRLQLIVTKADRKLRELNCRYILTPSTCYVPPELGEDSSGLWGLSTDLYALRSGTDWGAGDLKDLDALAREGGRRGAATIALSPLHLIRNRAPESISPYYPLSRRYRNPLYLAVEAVPEFTWSDEAKAIVASPSFAEVRNRVRDGDLVDYDAVATLKHRVARCLFETFMTRSFRSGDERDKGFEAYRKREGAGLRDTALFLALADYFGKANPPVWDWRDWPAGFRRKDSPAVEEFARRHAWELRFHEYLQWCIDEQLRDAASAAREAGMPIGLLHDLAVGSDPAGADVWAEPEIFVDGVEMGAPPDAFNMLGQAWGIPPLHPEHLRATGYDFFVRLVRATMRHAGAIRIDHILGFFRSFWVLRGQTPSQGAYVEYPAADLFGILALESHRHHALVVGEDLGVVTPAVHEAMERFRVLSSRLIYFERLPGGDFPPPAAYPRHAWSCVNTHDLPTFAGWWKGCDIDVKRQLDLFPPEGGEDWEGGMRWDRGVDRWRLLKRLHEEGIVSERFPREPDQLLTATAELRDAVWSFLSMTPSVLVTVGLHDLLLMEEQQNVPGTLDEYPNWRRKIREEIETEGFRANLDRAAGIFRRRGGFPGGTAGTVCGGPEPGAESERKV